MERTPITPPKQCFGLEQHRDNPLCRNCPHRRDCADLMGELAGRVDVDQVPFHFMPVNFIERCRDTNDLDPDLPHIERVYVFCYEWVFDIELKGEGRHRMVQNLRQHRALITERIREAEVSVKMFFVANMLAWKQSHGETRFHPRLLTHQFAAYQVKEFAKTCQERYGTFDITSMDRLMGSDVARHDFETNLLNSEVVAGAWIVNYKLFHAGNLLERLYTEKETALNPYWLAIEPSYQDQVLTAYRNNPDESCPAVVRRHRWDTIQVLGKLKKQDRKAIAVFSARERIMPEAVQRVLGQRGLRAEHFQIENVPVVNAIKFWVRLGIAIQHYECLKFVDDYPSIFDAHFTWL